MGAYRAALRMLPASFRAEYGEEMAAVVAQRRREAGGRAEALVVWILAFADVLSTAARAHADLLRQDLRQALAAARRAPGVALTAIAVTALGVGATTAAFSIADHVLLRPLPFPDAGRLVRVWQAQRERGYGQVELSPANYRDLERMSRSFEAIGAFSNQSFNLLGQGAPERLEGAAVTAGVLRLLGTRPLFGRVFGPDDAREGAPRTVVLSYALWRGLFGGDPGVLGRKVVLDETAHEVVGVMPAGFHFPRREVRLFVPLALVERDFENRDDLWLEAVARLDKGASLEEARGEMALLAARLERSYPRENAQLGLSVVSLRDQVSRQARVLLAALLGAALCVLLIACTNLAGLLAARGLERRKEMAVRAALGAGRERLTRQLLTEALALATAGGVLGVALAYAALPLVARLVPNSLPVADIPSLDLRVLVFAALATLATAIGFGLAPALRSFRDADASGLREGARWGVGGTRERLRAGLVTAQVAVSVLLLVSAGLLIRALWRVQAVDPGFRSAGVVTLRTALPLPRYAPAARRAPFYDRVLGEARRLPGVEGAAYISGLPMVMRGGIWTIEALGESTRRGDDSTASMRYVTPGYFAVLGIPLRRGRDVSESDTAASLPVAVVSTSFAGRYWPGLDPVGRRFRFGLLGLERLSDMEGAQERTVVGVVGDVRVRGLERASEPQVYLPHAQHPDGVMGFYVPKDLVVRSSSDPAALVPALRRIVAAADPEVPVSDVRGLAAVVEDETVARRTQLYVLLGFAGLAVALTAIGIHGLLAFSVSSRAAEIGVRVALGAARSDILLFVLGRAVLLGLAGAAAGLSLAVAAGRGLASLLAGVSPNDAATFLLAGAVAMAAVAAGGLVPALRALRLDPISTMRAE
jgi:putative ABC transport system permease protein